jgi:ferrous iron transport protein B
MSARNIENWKERLITILVTPFTTCSARLPVYAILISLIIPEERVFGFLSLQGLTLMGLYLLGFGMAIFSAYLLNLYLKLNCKSYFVVEMPSYKIPMFKNVGINVLEKTRSFVTGAGKIILALSVVLWFLGSHGLSDDFNHAEQNVIQEFQSKNISLNATQLEDKVNAYKLENSYIGYMGKAIEPAIQPLGYDWKIGIAVVSSFAAREVFVGTLATIYSVGSHSTEDTTIKNRMAAEVHPITGEKVFNFATGISLMLFYAFAMQCISTLAIVKKETNSWRWPIIQLVFMSGFAYIVALIAYQILS